MGLDLTPRCAKCGAHMDSASMKALPEGKGFVCINCYNRAAGGEQARPQLRDLPRRESTTTAQSQPRDVVGSSHDFFSDKTYVCDDCNYEFKKSAEFEVKICPFCGKTNIHQKVERPAQAYLADDDE